MNLFKFLTVVMACVFILPQAFAKGSRTTGIAAPVGALTPPPKEWAMFPDEPPPAQPAAPSNQPQNPANAPKPAAQNAPGGAPAPAMASVVSAAVIPAAPKRDLPVMWMVLTGLLSLGALMACGNLILKNDTIFAEEVPVIKMVAGVPVVSDAQEIA